MTPEEIKNFLQKNKDLFGPGLGEQAVIDVDDIHELIKRLFDSTEFKHNFIGVNNCHLDTEKYYRNEDC